MASLHLHEVILYVQDMQAQIAFYHDVLGLELHDAKNRSTQTELHWVTFKTGACTLALHSGGTRQYGADAPRFVLQVDDLQRWQRKLTDQGVQVGAVRSVAPGIDVLDVVDPEGIHFSLESAGT